MRLSRTIRAAWQPRLRPLRSEKAKLIRISNIVRRCACVAGFLLAALVPSARADYAVLQSGQRIHITGYERMGDTVRLTMTGGSLEIPADTLLRIDPEDTFLP